MGWSRSLVVLAGFAFGCSANAPLVSDDERIGGQDAGTSIALPNQEMCGNATDDDHDGLVDEGCDCQSTPSASGEIPSVGDCNGSDSGTTPECVPESPTEVACGDGADNDCDDSIDCGDPDCTAACSCEPTETKCQDGIDDDCDGKPDCSDDDCPKCKPGATRYCDEPVFCAWGKQTCGPDGRWGNCIETQPPPGCEGFFGINTYDEGCCVAQGYCCQAYPADTSVGNCAGIAACP